MKQENVKKILSALTNYAEHLAEEESPLKALDKVRLALLVANNHAFEPLTDETKSTLVHNAIMCLNDGSEAAMEEAFLLKLTALASGDEELIKKIEYLWEVI